MAKGPLEIAFKTDRPVGVKTDQHMIEANSILLNAPHQPPPTYFLGILDDVVPVGMAQDVLYLPDYARPDEFLPISVSADNDISSAPMSARATYGIVAILERPNSAIKMPSSVRLQKSSLF